MKKFLRFDWASKYLLKSKSNFGILEGFLSELLLENIKIKNLIVNPNQVNGSDEKSIKTEYLAESSKSEVVIQIQNNRDPHYYQRMALGTAKCMVDNFSGYSPQKKRFICINIVYSLSTHVEDYIYKGNVKFESLHKPPPSVGNPVLNGSHKSEYKEFFPEYYVIYVYNFKDVIKNSLDEWIYFLKNAEIKEGFKANGINEVKEKLIVDKLTADDRKKYELFLNTISNDPLEILQMKLKTENLLKEKEFKTKIEIARALKSQYVPLEIISTSTGLPMDKIQTL